MGTTLFSLFGPIPKRIDRSRVDAGTNALAVPQRSFARQRSPRVTGAILQGRVTRVHFLVWKRQPLARTVTDQLYGRENGCKRENNAHEPSSRPPQLRIALLPQLLWTCERT